MKDIFDDIKRTFDLPFVPNLFKAMANHPAYLETSWNRFKVIMGPGKLDRKTKEFLAPRRVHCQQLRILQQCVYGGLEAGGRFERGTPGGPRRS